ncbi:hypothetical protein H2204_005277 [Knufia peltigerae]|uniref:Xylanolytic transcriptional activator regulatory domain-containing protein n=1 Tax=Knufia peltigerae TaxID=1002370 RepID=A0AA38Y5Q1_9EURO|nr:hypothetical protein H2204_005277 [Knufia peltigerae]
MAIMRNSDLEDDILAIVSDGLKDPTQKDFAALWTDEFNEYGLFQRWKRSRVSRELENLLPSLENLPLNKVKDTSGEDEVEVVQELHRSDSYIQAQGIPQIRDASDLIAITEDAAMDDDIGGQNEAIKALHDSQNTVVLTASTPDLLNSYFTWTQSWLPIIEKHTIYREWHQYSEGTSTSLSGEHVCLMAITIYEQLHGPKSPRLATPEAAINGGDFYNLQVAIENLIPKDNKELRLAHVQALLILTLTVLGLGRLLDAWLLVGRCSRLILLLKSTSAGFIPSYELRQSPQPDRIQHVLLACFVIDSLLSSRLSIHPHIRPEDLTDRDLVEEDGDEEWTPLPQAFQSGGAASGPMFAMSTLNQLVQASKFYGRLSASSTSAERRLAELQLLEDDIESWCQGLPIKSRLAYSFKEDDLGHSPHLWMVQLILLSTLTAVVVQRKRLGQADPKNSYRLSALFQQLSLLLTTRAKNLNSAAIPPIWEPILSTLMDNIEEAESLSPTFTEDILVSLKAIVASASSVWPAFNDLNGRLESHSADTAELRRSTTQPPIQQGQATDNAFSRMTEQELVSASDPVGNDMNMSRGAIPADLHRSDLDLRLLQADDGEVTNTSTLCQIGPTEPIPPSTQSDTGSLMPDFVTMDALTWYFLRNLLGMYVAANAFFLRDSSWQQSFQHLGFSQLEATNDGLKSFFDEM